MKFTYDVVQRDTPVSRFPGLRSGDCLILDDPLPSWRTPLLRLRSIVWRWRQEARGFKVYVMDTRDGQWPVWYDWETKQGRVSGVRVHF